MTKRILSATIICLFLMACQKNTYKVENKSEEPVETKNESKIKNIVFTVAKNYFVKNTVKDSPNPKIETAEEFNEIFGMATTIGNEGKPTEINFQKQNVIALVLPETNKLTTIEPVGLQKNENGNITLIYKTNVGQNQSYTTRPSLVIVLDKTEKGNIELKELK